MFVLFDAAERGLWKASGPGANGKLAVAKGLTTGNPILTAGMAGNEKATGSCACCGGGTASDA